MAVYYYFTYRKFTSSASACKAVFVVFCGLCSGWQRSLASGNENGILRSMTEENALFVGGDVVFHVKQSVRGENFGGVSANALFFFLAIWIEKRMMKSSPVCSCFLVATSGDVIKRECSERKFGKSHSKEDAVSELILDARGGILFVVRAGKRGGLLP